MEKKTRTWHIRKDDFVEVITGKDKGKRGKVLRVHTNEGRIIVEKIHMIKRGVQPPPAGAAGGDYRA